MDETAIAERKEAACFCALTQFDEIARAISMRRRAALQSRLHCLLQYLTIRTDHTIEDAPREAIFAWIEPALGLWEYDLRIELLDLMLRVFPNPALDQPRQPGSSALRRVKAFLCWRRYHREIYGRTRPFFNAIKQEDIIEDERKCAPFYDALMRSTPQLGKTGVFVESDESVVAAIKRRAIPNEPPAILDIGCGRGRLLLRLAREFRGATLIGTSIYPFSDADLSHLTPHGIRAMYGTVNELDVPNASLDIVVSTEVIEHLRNPEDMVRELARILKPGGIFCVTAPTKAGYMYTPNPMTYISAALATIWPACLPVYHDLYAPLTPIRIVHFGFDVQQFNDLFRKHFDDVHVGTCRFGSFRKFLLEGAAPHLPILRSMGGVCIASGTKS